MGGAPRPIFRPTALSGSASRRYGSNTGGTSLQPRASPGFRRSLSSVCCSTGCGCGVRMHRLRTSEEGMSLAAIAAKLRFWVWDIPRDEVRASESDWSSGNWYSAHPVHFDRFMDIVHPDDRASLRQAVRGALEGDGQYETEYRVMLPDSTVRWIAGRGRIEFDQNGKPRQLRAISIDITERRRG